MAAFEEFKIEKGPTDKAKEPDPGGSDQQNLGFKKLKNRKTDLTVGLNLEVETKEDRKIEQHRGQLGVVLLRKKEGFQCLGSGSVAKMVPSKHFKSEKVVKCLLTSSDIFPDEDSSNIDDYVINYWDSNLKSVGKLELSSVANSRDFFRPTSGLALIPVLPAKVAFVLSYCNFKSHVLDDRRTFHTEYYWNEGGKSETRNAVTLRCFIAGFDADPLVPKPFTLISTKDEQGQLRYKLQDDNDRSIFETYGEIMAERPHLYPRGAPILKFRKLERKERAVTCVGVLNFSNDNKKEICPVFLTQETLTG